MCVLHKYFPFPILLMEVFVWEKNPFPSTITRNTCVESYSTSPNNKMPYYRQQTPNICNVCAIFILYARFEVFD